MRAMTIGVVTSIASPRSRRALVSELLRLAGVFMLRGILAGAREEHWATRSGRHRVSGRAGHDQTHGVLWDVSHQYSKVRLCVGSVHRVRCHGHRGRTSCESARVLRDGNCRRTTKVSPERVFVAAVYYKETRGVDAALGETLGKRRIDV